MFDVLRGGFRSCYVFAAGRGDATFVAASPELLVRREGFRAQTVALAGSTRRSADPAVDDHLGEQLRRSDKDREEQAIVTRRIARALRPHTVWVAAPDEPEIVKVANIQHLATPIRAQLREPLGAIELAGLLHPTPAVGGEPHAAAVPLIPALEGLDRGWYAGAVGWTDAQRGRGVLRRACAARSCAAAGALLRRRRRRARLRSGGRAGRDRGQARGAAARARGLNRACADRPGRSAGRPRPIIRPGPQGTGPLHRWEEDASGAALSTVLACLVVLVAAAPAGAAVPLTTLAGSLTVVHADALDEAAHDHHDGDHDHAGEYRTFLHAGGRHYELHPRRPCRRPGAGAAGRGHGTPARRRPRRRPRDAGRRDRGRGLARTAAATTTGTASVLVLLVTATVPDTVTPAQVQQLVGPSDDAWYRETSYAAYGQTATVPAWLKIATPPAGCALYDYVDLAETAARAKGIEPADYDRVMLYLPTGTHNCPGAEGYGEVVGGSRRAPAGWAGATVHELGHNLGLWHAHSLVCRDGTGAAVVLSGTCDPFDEYRRPLRRDGHRLQGSALQRGREGPAWLARRPLGQLEGAGRRPAGDRAHADGGRHGTQDAPDRSPDRAGDLARVPPGDRQRRLPEHVPRRDRRVLAHVVEPGNGTHLLDMTPGTPGDFADAALAAGKTYADPGGRFRLTPTSATATGVTVTVAPGPVPPAPPATPGSISPRRRPRRRSRACSSTAPARRTPSPGRRPAPGPWPSPGSGPWAGSRA